MATWSTREAQARLFDVIRACTDEPQLLCDQDEPVAALVDIRLFRRLMALKQQAPTMADLLAELESIQAKDPVELEIPARADRPNALLEDPS